MGLSHAPARHPSDHRSGPGRGIRAGVIALAALTFVAPLPVGALVTWRHAYASLQPAVTSLAAVLPVAAMDVLIVAATGGLVVALWRRRGAWTRRLGDAILTLAALIGGGWVVFLMLWGWHYQVPTLEARLAIQARELTAQRGEAFGGAVVAALNALSGEAHAQPWPGREHLTAVVGPHVSRVLPALGVSATPRWPRPRRTLLDAYFRAAGVDGMTNPFGLEILLNSRVLPVELPALIAHEYAHLAGFADESDASVVAWLACQTGDARLRYSAALAVLPHVLTGMPREARARLLREVGDGPRRDLQAISARLSEQQPWVHAVAWQTYDRFLKANRVGEGVARYDAVARVLVGVADPATGRLRRSPSTWPPDRR